MVDGKILNDLEHSDIIKLEYLLQAKKEMSKRVEILRKHPYKITEGKDGKFYTYLPDPQKKRVKRKRNTLEELQQVIIDYWREQENDPTLEEMFHAWNTARLVDKEISPAT